MRIKSIEVENFKNFEHQRVEFNDFNVFVGANAAGKSNFVNLIKFFKNINEKGFKKAIGELGGYKYLKNVNSPDKPFKFRIEFDYHNSFRASCPSKVEVCTQALAYEFIIDMKDDSISIIDDKLYIKGKSIKLDFKDEKLESNAKKYDDFNLTVSKVTTEQDAKNNVKIELEAEEYLIDWNFFPYRRVVLEEPKEDLILETTFDILINKFEPFKINLYDFNPKAARECTIYEKNTLEENGNNLPMAIKNILKDEEKKKKFHNLVSYVLPFIESINTLELPNDTILFEVKEKSSDKKFLSNLLSDGTINIIAIIVALFFEDNDVVILEEPERFIHPSLISSVVSLLNDVAGAKQIIVSTHNSEVVRYSGVERLLLVSRDKTGTSKITRPAESENLKVFLENDLGVADLFVDNMLEGLDNC